MKEIKMKVGLVGYGKMGKIREQSINNHPNIELVAIFDNNSDNNIPKNYISCKTFEDLLSQNIDAVFIATYVKYLSMYTIKSLDSGKHVFCEKPPSINLEEMKKILFAEEKSKKILKYGFNHRFHFSVKEAKRLIDTKKFGKILWIRGVYGKAGSIDFNKNWRNYKKISGGGILIDQGIHMVDLIRYFIGENLECLNSYIFKSFWNIDAEDNAFLLLKSESGVIANMHSSATQWKHKFLLEISLENGYINLDGILSPTRSYAPEKLIIGKREFEDVTFAMGKPKEETIYFENDKSWDFELEEFYNAIVKNKKIKNGTSNDAFELMKIIDNVYRNSFAEKL